MHRRRIKGIGGSLSGVGAVLIVGYADPVHILVAGVELRMVWFRSLMVAGENTVLMLEYWWAWAAIFWKAWMKVPLSMLDQLFISPPMRSRTVAFRLPMLQALGDVAVGGAVQHPLGASGGLRAEIPGQLDDPPSAAEAKAAEPNL